MRGESSETEHILPHSEATVPSIHSSSPDDFSDIKARDGVTTIKLDENFDEWTEEKQREFLQVRRSILSVD